jgi:hypothetical protein
MALPVQGGYLPALAVPGTSLASYFHFHEGVVEPAGDFAYFQNDSSSGLYWTNDNDSNWARLHADRSQHSGGLCLARELTELDRGPVLGRL